MAKKIYDIKPPKVAKKVEKEIKEFLATETKNTVVKRKHSTKKKKEMVFPWMPVSIGGAVVVVLVCVYLFFALPKATITIWPKVDTLSFQQTITADKSVAIVDVAKAVVPAQYFEASKTESQDFPATGASSDGGVASGTVTIYNKTNPVTPYTFKAGTHFMSDSGKLFVALQKIVIPAAKKVGSKITPGTVQVKIQAVEAGDTYNVAPSNFSIPGLKGTAAYYSVNATSSTAMTGGFTGKIKKITDDDIQEAKDVLVKKATDGATVNLKSQISSDFVLLDNAITSLTTDASTATKSGTVADNFSYKTTVKVSALAFKKDDLNKFAKNYILSQISSEKDLLDDSFKIDYSASLVDVSGGKATLDLKFSSGAYQSINENSLALSLLGKNANQIDETIKGSQGDGVSKTKISFWPFWVTSAPNSQKAVHINLKFQ